MAIITVLYAINLTPDWSESSGLLSIILTVSNLAVLCVWGETCRSWSERGDSPVADKRAREDISEFVRRSCRRFNSQESDTDKYESQSDNAAKLPESHH